MTSASRLRSALTIAGSDSGGGAGIQADLKTFSAFGLFGTSALTALTAQNTVGVQAVHEVPADFVVAQIEAVAGDIPLSAVKTGMLATSAVVHAVADAIERLALPNLVVDPVMLAKDASRLLTDEAGAVLRERLLPLARVVTPNLPEAEILAGMPIATDGDLREAAERIFATGCGVVVVKGGHRKAMMEGQRMAEDLVYDGRSATTLSAPFVEYAANEGSVHGTGCAFSAAVAAALARGDEPLDAVRRAKDFISRAIEERLRPGGGNPVPHHFTGSRLRGD